jgi:hypothetical protein
LDIQHGHIRVVLLDQSLSCLAIARLCHDLNIAGML